jgi:hypothetical protein
VLAAAAADSDACPDDAAPQVRGLAGVEDPAHGLATTAEPEPGSVTAEAAVPAAVVVALKRKAVESPSSGPAEEEKHEEEATGEQDTGAAAEQDEQGTPEQPIGTAGGSIDAIVRPMTSWYSKPPEGTPTMQMQNDALRRECDSALAQSKLEREIAQTERNKLEREIRSLKRERDTEIKSLKLERDTSQSETKEARLKCAKLSSESFQYHRQQQQITAERDKGQRLLKVQMLRANQHLKSFLRDQADEFEFGG